LASRYAHIQTNHSDEVIVTVASYSTGRLVRSSAIVLAVIWVASFIWFLYFAATSAGTFTVAYNVVLALLDVWGGYSLLSETVFWAEVADTELRWRTLVSRGRLPVTQVQSVSWSRDGRSRSEALISLAGRRLPLKLSTRGTGFNEFTASLQSAAPPDAVHLPD
jgi:hypothetical protein